MYPRIRVRLSRVVRTIKSLTLQRNEQDIQYTRLSRNYYLSFHRTRAFGNQGGAGGGWWWSWYIFATTRLQYDRIVYRRRRLNTLKPYDEHPRTISINKSADIYFFLTRISVWFYRVDGGNHSLSYVTKRRTRAQTRPDGKMRKTRQTTTTKKMNK